MRENDLISRSAILEIGTARKIIEVVGNWNELPGIAKSACTRLGLAHRKMIIDAPAVDAMVIPCKIGDTVWAIRPTRGGHLCAMKGVVSEMQFIGSEMRLSITIRGRCRGEWGKTIFATREEAEAEIARKRGRL